MRDNRLPCVINLLQNPGSTTWGNKQGLSREQPPSKTNDIDQQASSAKSSGNGAYISRASPTNEAALDVNNRRQASPELEIMEVRKIKKPIQNQMAISKASQPKSQIRPVGVGGQGLYQHAHNPVQKKEQFDMNLIDPALRDVGTPITSVGPAFPAIFPDIERQIIGVKRPAELDVQGDAKRIKETPKASLSSGVCHNLSEPLLNESCSQDPACSSTESTEYKSVAAVPRIPRWIPNTWSKQDYINLLIAADKSFNYHSFAHVTKRHPHEVMQVFRGLVINPIVNAVDAIYPTRISERHATGGNSPILASSEQQSKAENMMSTYINAETALSSKLAEESAHQLTALKARALSEFGAEMRSQIEAEIKTQLQTEGWVQLNKAKDLIGQYEREIQETKPDIGSGSDGDSKKAKNKVKPFAEAQKDLLAASIMFEKARRADERKNKLAERESKGTGEGKKLGRPPKKGEGKGKGADFI